MHHCNPINSLHVLQFAIKFTILIAKFLSLIFQYKLVGFSMHPHYFILILQLIINSPILFALIYHMQYLILSSTNLFILNSPPMPLNVQILIFSIIQSRPQFHSINLNLFINFIGRGYFEVEFLHIHFPQPINSFITTIPHIIFQNLNSKREFLIFPLSKHLILI